MGPWSVLQGDAIARLADLPDRSFHVAICSPPYWNSRDYGTGTWEGGAAGCDHVAPPRSSSGDGLAALGEQCRGGGHSVKLARPQQYRDLCGKCGARRIDQQLGLEKLADCFAWARQVPRCGSCYVCRMTDVFAAVRRVIRDDGTLWVNVAGSYAASQRGSGGSGGTGKSGLMRDGRAEGGRRSADAANARAKFEPRRMALGGWRPKDYVNVPALLAESLRCDGWYLRAEVCLTKLSPMPESCRDRPTRATEKLYLFAKQARYFYDAESERPAVLAESLARNAYPDNRTVTADDMNVPALTGNMKPGAHVPTSPAGRNLWDYWPESDDDLPPAVWPWRPENAGQKSGHYATFPLWLPLRVIRLATSARGVCPCCGSPWRRVVEKATGGAIGASWHPHDDDARKGNFKVVGSGGYRRGEHVGWQQTCKCPPSDPVPARVLDPFSGTASTGVAARLLGRAFTGIELSEPYCAAARERLASCVPLDDAAWLPPVPPPAPEQATLFPQES